MKKTVLRALCDGAVSLFAMQLTVDFSLSAFTDGWDLWGHMLAFLLSAVLAFAVCLFFVRDLCGKGEMLRFLLFGGLFFALCFMLDAVCRITVSFSIFPLRETNAADGIVLIIGCILFLLLSVALRLCLLAVKFAKKNLGEPMEEKR